MPETSREAAAAASPAAPHDFVSVVEPSIGLEGYLAIDGLRGGMAFGGTRIDPSVSGDVVCDLARRMSMKLAGYGSPVGGAKAGLRGSPDDPRLPLWLRTFADRCRAPLQSSTILGKDMGAKLWMIEEIYAALGIPQLHVARTRTGSARCPDTIRELGGYVTNMTGMGVFWAARQAAGGSLRDVRVAIQGFGVVGAGVAWHMARAGARVVAVSDREKAVVRDAGLSVDDLNASRDAAGMLRADVLPADCRVVERDALLRHDADALILAAGSYIVGEDLARDVISPLVVEGANLALLPAARAMLHRSGVRVVPDVIASSSSAALVAHQIASGNQREPEELWAGIRSSIERNTSDVLRVSAAADIDTVEAFCRLTGREAST